MIFMRDLLALGLFVIAILKIVEMAVGEFLPGGIVLVLALFALAWWIKPAKSQRDNAHPFWDWLDFITDLPYLAVATIIKLAWRLFKLGDNDPSL
jgi:hypothetical protein